MVLINVSLYILKNKLTTRINEINSYLIFSALNTTQEYTHYRYRSESSLLSFQAYRHSGKANHQIVYTHPIVKYPEGTYTPLQGLVARQNTPLLHQDIRLILFSPLLNSPVSLDCKNK
jgi:hypothetical protein